ncbi:hypothetical protein [Paenibacillus sp. YN15]|nr:hypothetical protein [Paenibacillus sp. YN15]
MENVFSYFFAIGSGLTLGVVAVILPAYWLLNKMKGGKTNVRNR